MTYDEEIEGVLRFGLLLVLDFFLRLLGEDFRLADIFQFLYGDVGQIGLNKVEVGVRQEGGLLRQRRLVRVGLNRELLGILDVLLVLIRVGVHIGKQLELLLDSSKLNATLRGALGEDLARVGEGFHQVEEVFLLQTVSVGGAVDGRFVALARSQVLQNLVVTEVVGRMQLEILILVLDSQADGHTALEDHVQLREVFALFDHRLVGDEHTAVERTDEVGHEFFASLNVLKHEQVTEVVEELLEKHLDQLESHRRLELLQEIVSFDQFLVIEGERLFDVELDLVVQNLGQGLAHSRVVQLDEPDINFLELALNNVAATAVDEQNVVDGAHDEGEESDSDEFDEHRVGVLPLGVTLEVTVADCGESGNHPIEGGDVLGRSVAWL